MDAWQSSENGLVALDGASVLLSTRSRSVSFLRIPSLCERACLCMCSCVCCVFTTWISSSFPTCAAHCCKYNTSFLNLFRYPVQLSTWTFSIKVMQLLSRASYIQEFKSWSSSFCVCVSLFYCFSLRLAAPAATSAVSFPFFFFLVFSYKCDGWGQAVDSLLPPFLFWFCFLMIDLNRMINKDADILFLQFSLGLPTAGREWILIDRTN